VADHGLGVAAGIKLPERAITDRVVELADYAPIGRQLELEVITEHTQTSLSTRLIELFLVVPAVFNRARELHLIIQAVAHADAGRLAIGIGARLRIAQLCALRAAAHTTPRA